MIRFIFQFQKIIFLKINSFYLNLIIINKFSLIIIIVDFIIINRLKSILVILLKNGWRYNERVTKFKDWVKKSSREKETPNVVLRNKYFISKYFQNMDFNYEIIDEEF